jgi:nucleotide-binding universal stress UspA family protein
MIAVDENEDSVEAARAAAALFGADAHYLVVNVGRTILPMGMTPWAFPSDVVPWGYVVQFEPALAGTGVRGGASPNGSAIGEVEEQTTADAAAVAASVAADAQVEHAEAVGATGDPASAIIEAAREHHADVIVVGSHDRSWFHRLFAGSVHAEVLRQAEIPVLVVK